MSDINAEDFLDEVMRRHNEQDDAAVMVDKVRAALCVLKLYSMLASADIGDAEQFQAATQIILDLINTIRRSSGKEPA